MFTSRAEYRLQLREDNADLRLAAIARDYGLLGDEQWRAFEVKREAIERERRRLADTLVRPEHLPAADAERVLGAPLKKEQRLFELLRRPEVSYAALMSLPGAGDGVTDPAVAQQVEIQAKYEGYLQRQHQEVERASRYESVTLPDSLDYAQVRGLSSEVREKLARHRPATVGQAGRIPGVTPAAISLLLVHLKKEGGLRRSA